MSDDYFLGALLGANTAARALIIIDSRKVIGNGNGGLRTISYAKSASDTTNGAGLHGNGTLVLGAASHNVF
jgi:hypothetical protein